MTEIILAGEKFQIPASWEEVPIKKLPKLLEAIFVKPESPETYHEVLRLVLGISETTWGKFCYHYFGKTLSDEVKNQNAEALHQVLTLVSWMWTDDMTTKPFESVTVKGIELLLFDEGFVNMSFGELSDGYIHLQAFVKQLVVGDERLNYLIATVCRPRRSEAFYMEEASWNGDHRTPYNPHWSKAFAKELEQLDTAQKIAIMVYFASSVKSVFEQYEIMDNGIDGVGEDDYPGQGLIKNQHLLAEKGIFGDMSRTLSANIHDVFLFLEEHRKDLKEQLAAQKQQHSI
ncbi:hypothetical protein VB264_16830 [Arcicella aquatica]|uniref:Uncharacterized protein n=1 Tax=Arcicella aquatica TaxID=217141 RepID=A0ABU5QQU3_9BACT|nr:hypothetical protein [Arcicella aquatica]MEA5259467.1 hypothetical protein [Arcicella aquatica]